jgi:hypothetical protein
MSQFPMSKATSLVTTKSIESLVQGALRTSSRDTKSVSTAVAKLLPDKVKAFANETKGLPRMTAFVEPAAPAVGGGSEKARLDAVVDGIRVRFKDLLDEVDSEQDTPQIKAIERAVMDAIDQGRGTAGRALSSSSRDMLFAARSILRERAFDLRDRGINLAPPTLLQHHFDLADDIDRTSALMLVMAGSALMQADAGSGETLLDIGVQELRVRAEQALRALDRLSGAEEHAYAPDAIYWPDHYNTLRDWLSLMVGGDQFRPFLVREQLAEFMYRLIDVVGEGTDYSFREAQAGVLAGCQFLDDFIAQLLAFDPQRLVLGLPMPAAGDPDRYQQFENALAQFRAGFTGTEGVLIIAAAQPLVMQTWALLRNGPALPAGPAPIGALLNLIPVILRIRALVAQTMWQFMNNVPVLQWLVGILYGLDVLLDLTLRGNVLIL